jgi:hypothetical protein
VSNPQQDDKLAQIEKRLDEHKKAIDELARKTQWGIAPGTVEVRAFRPAGSMNALDPENVPAGTTFDVTGRVLGGGGGTVFGVVYSGTAQVQAVSTTNFTNDAFGNPTWRLAFAALAAGPYVLVATWLGSSNFGMMRGSHSQTFTVV